MVKNSINHAFSAPGTSFSNPTLNILRSVAEGHGLPAEANASVQASGTTATQWASTSGSSTWLLTARITPSGGISIYSN